MKTIRTLVGFSMLAMIASLAGCDLYLGDGGGGGDNFNYGYCDQHGCYECDEFGCWGVGGNPGWHCQTNEQCAEGSYCDSNSDTCVETGFCYTNSDCLVDEICDNRNTCVPPDTQTPGCVADSDCPWGTYCDEPSGLCVGAWSCHSDTDCAVNEMCDDRNTCIPVDPNDPGSCNAPITCTTLPPSCASDATPAIKDGCYTGECILIVDCDVPPPPPVLQCSDHTDAASCNDDPTCIPVYGGTNCTDPNGGTCEPGSTNCTCQSFEFAVCRDA